MDTGEREAERPTSVGNGSAICRRSLERCKSGMKFWVRSEIVPVQDSCWSTITQNSGPGSHGSQIAWILRLCFRFNGSGTPGSVNGHPGRWGAARCAAQVQLRDARMRFPDPRAPNAVLRIMYIMLNAVFTNECQRGFPVNESSAEELYLQKVLRFLTFFGSGIY